jgi:hypothetical protein
MNFIAIANGITMSTFGTNFLTDLVKAAKLAQRLETKLAFAVGFYTETEQLPAPNALLWVQNERVCKIYNHQTDKGLQ